MTECTNIGWPEAFTVAAIAIAVAVVLWKFFDKM